MDPWSNQSALLIVDMQVDLVRSEGFTVSRLKGRGLDEVSRDYLGQLDNVIPNLQVLLERFRANAQTVIHVRTNTPPGRQSGGQETNYERLPFCANGLEVIDELTPLPTEIVLTKGCAGVFVGTNLDFQLRRMGVTSLVVGGVVTNGCVAHAINHGHDLGYSCVLVSDGSAALTEEIHSEALIMLHHRRAHVIDTVSLLDGGVIQETTVRLVSPA